MTKEQFLKNEELINAARDKEEEISRKKYRFKSVCDALYAFDKGYTAHVITGPEGRYKVELPDESRWGAIEMLRKEKKIAEYELKEVLKMNFKKEE